MKLTRSQNRALRAVFWGSATLVAAMPSVAYGQSIYSQSYTAAIQKKGVSLWPTGQGTGNNLSPVLIGPSWSLGQRSLDAYGELTIPEIRIAGFLISPEIHLGKTGFQIRYEGSGRVGFEIKPYYSGGTMDLSYYGAIRVSGIPSLPVENDTITLTLSYATTNGSYFTTTAPDFGIGADAVFHVTGKASSTGWFLGDTVWDGNIFDPFDKSSSSAILPLTKFNDVDAIDRITRAFNQATGVVNPLPIGATILRPTLIVHGDTVVASDGTLSGKGFAPFMNVETDALAWITMFLPPPVSDLVGLLSGDFPIPGTGANVSWDIAKMYANMDLGFRGDYKVTPRPALGVDVYRVNADGTETAIASGGNTVTFRMPNARIRVRPRLTLDLDLTSSVGFAVGGEIGTSPFRVGLDGTIGFGDRKQSYDIDVDPAHLAWKPEPSGSAKFVDKTYRLDHTERTFDGFTIGLANLLELPPTIVPQTSTGADSEGNPLELTAYAQDRDTANDPRITVFYRPARNYTFFYNSAGSLLDVEVVPAVPGGPETYFDPFERRISGQEELQMTFHSTDLKPGRYTIHTTLKGTNRNGVFKTAQYRTPLNINYARGIFSGAFSPTDDQAFTLNRVVADGTDQLVYVTARNFYRDTQVVMNGSVILPRQDKEDSPGAIQDGQQFWFKVPADVAKRFAGRDNDITLVTRDLSGDGTGKLISEPRKLFIVANAPTINSISYKDEANGTLPLGANEVGFEVRGTNLTEVTTLQARWTDGSGARTTLLPTSYSGPSTLRATLEPAFLKEFHTKSADGRLSLVAVTPTVNVPADSFNDDVVSGGSSSPFVVKLVHPKPTITRFEPAILVKDAEATTVKVYGDNLMRDPSGYYAQKLAAGFDSRATIAYPSGSDPTVPYILVTFPSDSSFLRNVGRHDVRVDYQDVRSDPNYLLTEYGKPTISTATDLRMVVRADGSGLLTIGGGLFYSNSRAFLNGVQISATLESPLSLTLRPTAAQLASVTGSALPLVVNNPAPGGGDSNSVTLHLVEGDPAKFSVKTGPVTFDRASGKYVQNAEVTYKGNRELPDRIELALRNLPSGVTVDNATGTSNGDPTIRVNTTGGTVKVRILFSRTGSAAIKSTPEIVLP